MEKLETWSSVHESGTELRSVIRKHDIIIAFIAGRVLGNPVYCSKGDIVRKGVFSCGITGDRKWAMALLA
jgi:hypothetical protein